MGRPKKAPMEVSRCTRPPAKTKEGRENQLISLAIDLAESQLANGTASPSVITHYLKLASTREKLEKEKLAKENELLKAKTEAIESGKKIEEMYKEALDAMRLYSGSPSSYSNEVIDDEDTDL